MLLGRNACRRQWREVRRADARERTAVPSQLLAFIVGPFEARALACVTG